MPSMRTLVVWTASYGLFLVTAGQPAMAASVTDEFTRGYAQAILDRDFKGSSVRVSEIRPEQLVVLTADRCIDPRTRGRIEKALLTKDIVASTDWVGTTECGTQDAPVADDEVTVAEALPDTDIFEPPLADPREPRATARYLNYDSDRDSYNAAAVSLGDSFPFANLLDPDGGKFQVAVEAGIFSLFNLDSDSKDLQNADYLGGLALTYKRGPWSARGRIFHQSSHLGDEFLLNHPGFERQNLSYEELNGLIAYQLEGVRIYGGGGAIVRSETDLDPFHLQGGIELRAKDLIGTVDLIGAADFQAREELDYDVDQSYLFGVGLNNYRERELRIMGGYFSGYSPNGQFYVDAVDFWSLGIYYDL